MDPVEILSSEFHLKTWQTRAVVELLDAGNTIPFIARYRKEAHGSVDDQTLRALAERLDYLRGLDKRREEIAGALAGLGVLDDALGAALAGAGTLAELEDIYRPYRPKRRTRASVAKERGLEPLARWLFLDRTGGDPVREAEKYLTDDVPDADSALAGARDIVAETVSDDAALRRALRELIHREGVLETRAAVDKDSVYRMYYGFSQKVSDIAAHRVLAVNRGEREGYLKVTLHVPEDKALVRIRRAFVHPQSGGASQVSAACQDAWERLLFPSLEREKRAELTDAANEGAIQVFSRNLRELLMQPPVKGRVILGVDPGFRTGCKLAVVDETGKVLETGVGHFTLPGQERQREAAARLIRGMVQRHGVTAVAIGNGTASRESEEFIASLLPELPGVAYAIVSEAGAAVYSASPLAAREFPDFDVSLRSAVSIARRLQDPLAELVKIDPKAIGVGQYQHDLKQNRLTDALNGVVEQCVNDVGVEVSTASAQLLAQVAGIGPALAENIVAYREENGIRSRAALKKVPKLGPRAFEQCAGFLRVRESPEPLDATGVHPESYGHARELLKKLGFSPDSLRRGGIPEIPARAGEYGLERLAGELGIGLPTLTDILSELKKPGRDPREELPKPLLRRDVLELKDLKPGMELTGTVRNVIDFGAFVDVGVHQDGLVHISRMADRYIRHPSDVVKVGDVVKAWVVETDPERKKIALTMVRDKR